MRSKQTRRRLYRAALQHGVSWALAAIFLLPLLWALSASLRAPGEAPPTTVVWVPERPSWSNYQRIFELVPLERFILNSLSVVMVAVPATLLTASTAGFAMAQLDQRARRRLMLGAILLLMVPMTALWLTRSVIFRYLGLIDHPIVLMLPSLMGTSPFFILLFYWTFRRVPAELFDSARLDGANVWRTWRSIGLPLARPTMVVVGVLSFVFYWSDFINPLLYLKSEQHYTLPVGIQMLQQMDESNWPLLMAASIVLVLPVITLFLLVQRYFWPEGRLSGIK